MKVGSIAAVLTSFVIGLPVGIILLLGGGDNPCASSSTGPAPSAAASNGIPANYLALYQDAGQKYGIPWNLIAAIGFEETDHGRSTLPGVSSGENSAGAGGPMQFLQGTFDQYGVDGNNDGITSRYDPRDAIPSAANYLRASGAPGDLHAAIFTYNQSEAYVAAVLAKMREYAGTAPVATGASTTTATTAAAAPGPGPILNVGDSLAVGSGPPLLSALNTVTTLAAKNRTSSQGLAALRGVSSVPATLIVQLGTNDTDVSTFRANVLSVLAIARKNTATVLWVNIARPPLGGTTDVQLNAVLADVASTHPELKIVDWKGAVDAGRVHLADGVHPTSAGYGVRAQLIADAINGASAAAAPVGGCADAGGLTAATGDGSFTIAPDANLAGHPLTADLTTFVGRMATFYAGTLIVTSGTNHDTLTQSGNVSDHASGNAADFGMVLNHGTDDGPVGDAIAAAAFMAAGLPHDVAVTRGQAGGAETIVSNGLRIQTIWKIDTPALGNHRNHVHVGVARLP